MKFIMSDHVSMADSYVDGIIREIERTPTVLDALLRGLSPAAVQANEGEGTWSAYDVVGHLVHAERADWIPRMTIILQHGKSRPFDPFDREAQFVESAGKTLDDLLKEFRDLRGQSIATLRKADLREEQLDAEGTHPVFGTVKLRQLLATWAAHDYTHIVQISRTLAKRYREDVGPWTQYLSVMK